MLEYPNQTDLSVCRVDDIGNKGGFRLDKFFIGMTITVFESLKCPKIQHFKRLFSDRIFFKLFSFVFCTKKWTEKQ